MTGRHDTIPAANPDSDVFNKVKRAGNKSSAPNTKNPAPKPGTKTSVSNVSNIDKVKEAKAKSKPKSLKSSSVTFLQNTRNPKSFSKVTLESALKKIKGNDYKAEIERLRTLSSTEYKKQKINLPSFVWNGTFNDSVISDNFAESSGLFGGDIDTLRSGSTWEKAKADLAALPYIVAVFVSPSGEGLKFIVRIDPESIKNDNDFKRVYTQIEAALDKLEFKIDPACKDVRRLCFVSHDPKLYFNWKASVFAENPRSRHEELIKLALERQTAMEASISGYGYQLTGDPAADSVGIVVSMLENAQPGERHGARVKAAFTAGGFVAGSWVDQEVMMVALRETSDKISDSDKTSAPEWKTILETFEKGKLEPFALPDPDKDQSADMAVINKMLDKMANDDLAWTEPTVLDQLLILQRSDIRGFEEVTKKLKLLKVGEGKLKEALKKHGANNAVARPSKPSRSSPPTGGNAKLSSPISWSSFPHTTRTGRPKATVENLDHLLKTYGITCYYDEMLKKQFVVFPNEAECKNDMSENGKIQHIRSLLALNDVALSASDLLAVILMKNAVNPVLNLITGKAWDGKSRLKKLFKTITVPKEDINYRDKLLLTWFIQCVAAADGAVRSPIPHKIPKYELVLTLQGFQGTMKTSWFTALLPKNYAEYIVDGVHLNIDDKDTVKKAVSGWIVELGELDSTFRKSDVAQFKAFMSNRFDTIRLPYDRVASEFQRRTSFCASVNDSRFITDTTGARRLGVLKVDNIVYDHKIDMQQLWAEVWQLYLAGEQWWPDDELKAMCASRESQHAQICHVEDAMQSLFDLEIKPKAGAILNCKDILTVCELPLNKVNTNLVANVLEKRGFKKASSKFKKNGFRLTRLENEADALGAALRAKYKRSN